MYFSHGKTNAGGVITYIPNQLVKYFIKDIRDDEGRILIIKLNIDGVQYSLVNIYAPTQNNQKDQKKFYEKLSSYLEDIKDTKIIIGGDFNTVLDPTLDRYRPKTNKPSKIGLMVKGIMQQFNLKDIWRIRNNDVKRYTWKRTSPILQQSRIDYFLISETMEYCVNYSNIELSFMSDHSVISLDISSNPEAKRGPGYWKINNELLNNEFYCAMIEDILKKQDEDLDTNIDDSTKWDVIKMILRRETITFSKRRAKEIREANEALSRELIELEKKLADEKSFSHDLLENYLTVKSEWEASEKYKMQGAIIRSKTKWYEDGEKNSKYFFSLEKYNYEIKNIKKLKSDNNTSISDPSEILDFIRKFYMNLYKEDSNVEINDDNLDQFPNSAKVSQSDNLILESPITEKEIWEAIQDLPAGKTPGTDGLSSDFYKKFWPLLKKYFLNMVNNVYKNKELTSDQKRGVISLLPKPDKDLTQVKNWRPISILNTDYKILTKILANRIKPILPSLIHSDQTGFVLDRLIGENIRIIHDLFHYCKEKNENGILVLLDFEKAFDSLNWEFLDYVLKSYGFGEYYITWIKIFYTNINSCVINNGYMSNTFNLKRGIRQGCPISAYLFILCVELLAQKIRADIDVVGLDINNINYKILQFADDTALILKDQNSLVKVMKIIKEFYHISGLKLNVEKTTLVNMRNSEEIPIHPELSLLGLHWCEDVFRYLGVWFHKEKTIMEYKNFRHRLENIKNLLRIWLRRDLSLKGKITILKSLALSQLIYTTSMIPIPQWVIKEANTLFYNFLWNHKPERINRATMQKPIGQGGLKMINIELMNQMLKIKWLQRISDDPTAKWANIPGSYFKNISIIDFCRTNFIMDYVPKDLPLFYKECMESLLVLKKSQPEEGNEIFNEFIWYNKNITSGVTPYFYRKWYDKGVKFIYDLLDKNNEFLLQDDFQKKFGIDNVNFLEYLGLRQAVSSAWKDTLKNSSDLRVLDDDIIYIEIDNELISLNRCNNNILYNQIMKNIHPHPANSYYFWRDLAGVDDDELYKMFYVPFIYTRDTKVQSLQFKILHNTYACRLKLKHWRRKPSDLCLYCNEIDNLVHHFCDCEEMITFWNSLIKWWDMKCSDCNVLNNTDIMLGIIDNRCHMTQLNFIILHAKWFISRCKLQEERTDFLTFLPELYTKIRLEKNVLMKQKKLDVYIKLWGNLIEY
jgi:exonuclease III